MNTQKLNLATLGVEEMNETELQNVDGGKLPNSPWYFYLVAPGTALVWDTFANAYNSEC